MTFWKYQFLFPVNNTLCLPTAREQYKDGTILRCLPSKRIESTDFSQPRIVTGQMPMGPVKFEPKIYSTVIRLDTREQLHLRTPPFQHLTNGFKYYWKVNNYCLCDSGWLYSVHWDCSSLMVQITQQLFSLRWTTRCESEFFYST